MATVVMKRGTNATMLATDPIDGLLYFNSDDKCMYLCDGTHRDVYGGKTELLTSLNGENNGNAYSALAVKNNYVKNIDYTSDMSTVNSNITSLNTQVSTLQGQLRVNSNTFYFDYQDGKWGFNTSSNRGADTFHPFNSTNLLIGGEEISATTASLQLSTTNVTAGTKLSIDFMKGTCARAYCSCAYDLSYTGDLIHIFDDYNGENGSSNGTHEHYVFDTAWHKSTTAPSPLKTLESSATLGLPFTVNKLVQSEMISGMIWGFREDDLYFYVCTTSGNDKLVKIYKYTWNSGATNTYSGTWELVNGATYTLSTLSTRNNWTIGSPRSIVVYKNRLHIFGGSYVQNGATVADNTEYIWNPINKSWSTKSLPSGLIGQTICGTVVNDNKICIMLSNKQMAQYDGTTWTFATLDIDTALTYDVGTCFVSYNSQIRWFGGNTHPKIQVELDKSLVDGYDYVAYQLTALKYNFKEGCAIVTYPGITNSFSGRWNETNIDVTKIKSIHLLGTSQTGKDSASTPVAYKRYHRIVQDTYIGNIDNGDTYYTTT